MNFTKKLQITYPCVWEYAIFLPLNTDARQILDEILNKEYKLTKSRQNAKYQSFKLNLLVFSDNERLEIFEKLKQSCAFVL